jgi:hypothetical protein
MIRGSGQHHGFAGVTAIHGFCNREGSRQFQAAGHFALDDARQALISYLAGTRVAPAFLVAPAGI